MSNKRLTSVCFVVPAGAAYVTTSEVGIYGNAMFTHNSVSNFGGEKVHPSCITCDEVKVNTTTFGSVFESEATSLLDVIKKTKHSSLEFASFRR